jgi:hypothetical protein
MTRDTGGDGVGVGCCDLCYEIGGVVNSIWDNCNKEANIKRYKELYAEVIAKGGKLEKETF